MDDLLDIFGSEPIAPSFFNTPSIESQANHEKTDPFETVDSKNNKPLLRTDHYTEVESTQTGKQTLLCFDDDPTACSGNDVTSGLTQIDSNSLLIPDFTTQAVRQEKESDSTGFNLLSEDFLPDNLVKSDMTSEPKGNIIDFGSFDMDLLSSSEVTNHCFPDNNGTLDMSVGSQGQTKENMTSLFANDSVQMYENNSSNALSFDLDHLKKESSHNTANVDLLGGLLEPSVQTAKQINDSVQSLHSDVFSLLSETSQSVDEGSMNIFDMSGFENASEDKTVESETFSEGISNTTDDPFMLLNEELLQQDAADIPSTLSTELESVKNHEDTSLLDFMFEKSIESSQDELMISAALNHESVIFSDGKDIEQTSNVFVPDRLSENSALNLSTDINQESGESFVTPHSGQLEVVADIISLDNTLSVLAGEQSSTIGALSDDTAGTKTDDTAESCILPHSPSDSELTHEQLVNSSTFVSSQTGNNTNNSDMFWGDGEGDGVIGETDAEVDTNISLQSSENSETTNAMSKIEPDNHNDSLSGQIDSEINRGSSNYFTNDTSCEDNNSLDENFQTRDIKDLAEGTDRRPLNDGENAIIVTDGIQVLMEDLLNSVSNDSIRNDLNKYPSLQHTELTSGQDHTALTETIVKEVIMDILDSVETEASDLSASENLNLTDTEPPTKIEHFDDFFNDSNASKGGVIDILDSDVHAEVPNVGTLDGVKQDSLRENENQSASTVMDNYDLFTENKGLQPTDEVNEILTEVKDNIPDTELILVSKEPSKLDSNSIMNALDSNMAIRSIDPLSELVESNSTSRGTPLLHNDAIVTTNVFESKQTDDFESNGVQEVNIKPSTPNSRDLDYIHSLSPDRYEAGNVNDVVNSRTLFMEQDTQSDAEDKTTIHTGFAENVSTETDNMSGVAAAEEFLSAGVNLPQAKQVPIDDHRPCDYDITTNSQDFSRLETTVTSANEELFAGENKTVNELNELELSTSEGKFEVSLLQGELISIESMQEPDDGINDVEHVSSESSINQNIDLAYTLATNVPTSLVQLDYRQQILLHNEDIKFLDSSPNGVSGRPLHDIDESNQKPNETDVPVLSGNTDLLTTDFDDNVEENQSVTDSLEEKSLNDAETGIMPIMDIEWNSSSREVTMVMDEICDFKLTDTTHTEEKTSLLGNSDGLSVENNAQDTFNLEAVHESENHNLEVNFLSSNESHGAVNTMDIGNDKFDDGSSDDFEMITSHEISVIKSETVEDFTSQEGENEESVSICDSLEDEASSDGILQEMNFSPNSGEFPIYEISGQTIGEEIIKTELKENEIPVNNQPSSLLSLDDTVEYQLEQDKRFQKTDSDLHSNLDSEFDVLTIHRMEESENQESLSLQSSQGLLKPDITPQVSNADSEETDGFSTNNEIISMLDTSFNTNREPTDGLRVYTEGQENEHVERVIGGNKYPGERSTIETNVALNSETADSEENNAILTALNDETALTSQTAESFTRDNTEFKSDENETQEPNLDSLATASKTLAQVNSNKSRDSVDESSNTDEESNVIKSESLEEDVAPIVPKRKNKKRKDNISENLEAEKISDPITDLSKPSMESKDLNFNIEGEGVSQITTDANYILSHENEVREIDEEEMALQGISKHEEAFSYDVKLNAGDSSYMADYDKLDHEYLKREITEFPEENDLASAKSDATGFSLESSYSTEANKQISERINYSTEDKSIWSTPTANANLLIGGDTEIDHKLDFSSDIIQNSAGFTDTSNISEPNMDDFPTETGNLKQEKAEILEFTSLNVLQPPSTSADEHVKTCHTDETSIPQTNILMQNLNPEEISKHGISDLAMPQITNDCMNDKVDPMEQFNDLPINTKSPFNKDFEELSIPDDLDKTLCLDADMKDIVQHTVVSDIFPDKAEGTLPENNDESLVLNKATGDDNKSEASSIIYLGCGVMEVPVPSSINNDISVVSHFEKEKVQRESETVIADQYKVDSTHVSDAYGKSEFGPDMNAALEDDMADDWNNNAEHALVSGIDSEKEEGYYLSIPGDGISNRQTVELPFGDSSFDHGNITEAQTLKEEPLLHVDHEMNILTNYNDEKSSSSGQLELQGHDLNGNMETFADNEDILSRETAEYASNEESCNQDESDISSAPWDFDDNPFSGNTQEYGSTIINAAIKRTSPSSKEGHSKPIVSSAYVPCHNYSTAVPSSVFIDKDMLSDDESLDDGTSSSEEGDDTDSEDNLYGSSEQFDDPMLGFIEAAENMVESTFLVATSQFAASNTQGSSFTYQGFDAGWEDIEQSQPKFNAMPAIMEESEPSDTEDSTWGRHVKIGNDVIKTVQETTIRSEKLDTIMDFPNIYIDSSYIDEEQDTKQESTTSTDDDAEEFVPTLTEEALIAGHTNESSIEQRGNISPTIDSNEEHNSVILDAEIIKQELLLVDTENLNNQEKDTIQDNSQPDNELNVEAVSEICEMPADQVETSGDESTSSNGENQVYVSVIDEELSEETNADYLYESSGAAVEGLEYESEQTKEIKDDNSVHDRVSTSSSEIIHPESGRRSDDMDASDLDEEESFTELDLTENKEESEDILSPMTMSTDAKVMYIEEGNANENSGSVICTTSRNQLKEDYDSGVKSEEDDSFVDITSTAANAMLAHYISEEENSISEFENQNLENIVISTATNKSEDMASLLEPEYDITNGINEVERNLTSSSPTNVHETGENVDSDLDVTNEVDGEGDGDEKSSQNSSPPNITPLESEEEVGSVDDPSVGIIIAESPRSPTGNIWQEDHLSATKTNEDYLFPADKFAAAAAVILNDSSEDEEIDLQKKQEPIDPTDEMILKTEPVQSSQVDPLDIHSVSEHTNEASTEERENISPTIASNEEHKSIILDTEIINEELLLVDVENVNSQEKDTIQDSSQPDDELDVKTVSEVLETPTDQVETSGDESTSSNEANQVSDGVIEKELSEEINVDYLNESSGAAAEGLEYVSEQTKEIEDDNSVHDRVSTSFSEIIHPESGRSDDSDMDASDLDEEESFTELDFTENKEVSEDILSPMTISTNAKVTSIEEVNVNENNESVISSTSGNQFKEDYESGVKSEEDDFFVDMGSTAAAAMLAHYLSEEENPISEFESQNFEEIVISTATNKSEDVLNLFGPEHDIANGNNEVEINLTSSSPTNVHEIGVNVDLDLDVTNAAERDVYEESSQDLSPPNVTSLESIEDVGSVDDPSVGIIIAESPRSPTGNIWQEDHLSATKTNEDYLFSSDKFAAAAAIILNDSSEDEEVDLQTKQEAIGPTDEMICKTEPVQSTQVDPLDLLSEMDIEDNLPPPPPVRKRKMKQTQGNNESQVSHITEFQLPLDVKESSHTQSRSVKDSLDDKLKEATELKKRMAPPPPRTLYDHGALDDTIEVSTITEGPNVKHKTNESADNAFSAPVKRKAPLPPSEEETLVSEDEFVKEKFIPPMASRNTDKISQDIGQKSVKRMAPLPPITCQDKDTSFPAKTESTENAGTAIISPALGDPILQNPSKQRAPLPPTISNKEDEAQERREQLSEDQNKEIIDNITGISAIAAFNTINDDIFDETEKSEHEDGIVRTTVVPESHNSLKQKEDAQHFDEIEKVVLVPGASILAKEKEKEVEAEGLFNENDPHEFQDEIVTNDAETENLELNSEFEEEEMKMNSNIVKYCQDLVLDVINNALLNVDREVTSEVLDVEQNEVDILEKHEKSGDEIEKFDSSTESQRDGEYFSEMGLVRVPGDGSEDTPDINATDIYEYDENGQKSETLYINSDTSEPTVYRIPLKTDEDSDTGSITRPQETGRTRSSDTVGSIGSLRYLTDSEEEEESIEQYVKKLNEPLISLDDDATEEEDIVQTFSTDFTTPGEPKTTVHQKRKSLVPPSALILSVALDDLNPVPKEEPLQEYPVSGILETNKPTDLELTDIPLNDSENDKPSRIPKLPTLKEKVEPSAQEPVLIRTKVELIPEEKVIPIIAMPMLGRVVHWEKVTVKNVEYKIDETAIQPYKKVISHGGFYDDKSPIIEVFTSYLPSSNIPHYTWVMDNLFLYVLATIELLAQGSFSIVIFVGSTPKHQIPANSLLKRWHQHVDYRLKKEVEAFYIVNPTFYFRTMARLFVSRKVLRKMKYIKNMDELKTFIPTDFLFVPKEIAR